MSISVDWPDKIINVPTGDMSLIQESPVVIRELNLNDFHLALRGLEDDAEGMPYLKTHNHVAPVSVGGLTLARVIELVNDYTVTFEDGQYAVNLVGANSNVGDNINVNQVSVRSFNSAGLVFSADIEYASFNGGVSFDEDGVYSGTTFPVGTPRQPVNNLDDAMLIASVRGFNTIYVLGDATLNSDGDYTGMIFVGESITKSSITLSAGADLTNCEFYSAEVSGTLDGNTLLKDCMIGTLNYVYGVIERCLLEASTITLGGSNPAYFLDCWCGSVTNLPVIDLGGAGQALAIRGYSGGIKLINKTGAETVCITLAEGQLELDSTITNGTVQVVGVGQLIDNSVGATVVSDYLVQGNDLLNARKMTYNDATLSGDILTIFDDDNVTPWKTFDLSSGGRVQT